MLKIRKAKLEDSEAIASILEANGYSVPEHFIDAQVIVDENDAVRGIAHLTSILESTFLIDESLPLADRVSALKELMDMAVQISAKLGYRSFTVSTSKDNVERLLVNKFDFQPCKGKNLIKRIEAPNG